VIVPRQAVAGVGRSAVRLGRVQQREWQAYPVALHEYRRPGPERRRHQQQAAAQVVLVVVTLPFQPVVPPLQLRVQRVEQRLVSARGQHGHPPGDLAVKRAAYAVPARCDDRVVQVTERAHHHVQRSAVAAGQVPQPGRGPAGAVSPSEGEFRA
jgi:hypothetical protein